MLTKLDVTREIAWTISIDIYLSSKMFDVDASENLVHIGQADNSLTVISLNATTGEIYSSK